MKSTSQTTNCIACGSAEVFLESMWFMAEDARFPICTVCSAYMDRVFRDPSFGAAHIQFLGATDIQQMHQRGGAFSCAIPDGSLPADFASRMADFDLYCAFVGQRIRALRSIDSHND